MKLSTSGLGQQQGHEGTLYLYNIYISLSLCVRVFVVIGLKKDETE